MNTKADNWLGPPSVSTPDIVEDICKYIDPSMSEERFNKIAKEERKKLVVVTERLELIEHFQVISQKVKACQVIKRRSYKSIEVGKGEKPQVQVSEEYDLTVWGHQFAGLDFDLDSLCVYLYSTCVDTIKGPPEYLDAFDWLAKKEPDTFSGATVAWEDLKDDYRQEYGPSRLFREAFVTDLDADMRNLLVTFLAVVKIKNQEIRPESRQAWTQRSDEDKVRKIADQLYSARSTFTHTSLREFSPEVPVSSIPNRKGTLVRRADGPTLCEILKRVVTELVKSLLLGRS